ncbi:hypothetical protein H0H81_002178 [Sphagnurus paluster]|uniref:DDE-1 domain-containing protein n=1 Tax=Sphagnurus paluster TaxID=117069 RepID=A0A9P7KF10_9AGAR|nr:hypothetical protein H0H81_002178 [Sphagnurus paluster]
MEKYLVKLTREELDEQISEEFQRLDDIAESNKAERLLAVEDAAAEKRRKATERQQRCRARKKMEEVEAGLRNKDGHIIKKACSPKCHYTDPSISRRKSRKKTTSQSTKGRILSRASPTNWFSAELWPAIDKAAKICQFRTREMVKMLQSGAGGSVYTPLQPGTVSHWIARDSTGQSLRKWTDSVVAKVTSGGGRDVMVVRLGRPQAMICYPEMVRRIRKDLEINRNSGLQISIPIARVIVLSYVQTMAPELIASRSFKCTRAAQKTPENWENLCEDAFLRIVYHALLDGTLPEALINGDQLGVRLIPLGNKTWAPYGAKQVATFGKEEKRQFTLMVTTTCSGEILPFQCIYKGRTKNSLPSESVRVEAEKAGFVFSCGGDNHWSNLECVKEWVNKVIVPYLNALRLKKGLAKISSLVIIDCWSVHRGEPFLTWMKVEHGRIRLAFIPGGCTGKFQPNDVGIQRIVKHIFQRESSLYFINNTKKQLAARPNASVKFNTEIAPLRNATVGWALSAFKYLQDNPKIVQQAWKNCVTKRWNLSYECITSDEARQTLRERIAEDAQFALSVSVPHVDNNNGVIAEDFENTDDFVDDSAVTADQLAGALGLLEASGNIGQDRSHWLEKDDEGNVILSGGLDDELADADAEGDVDHDLPESTSPGNSDVRFEVENFSDHDDAGSSEDIEMGLPMPDPENFDFPIDEAYIRGVAEVFSRADAPHGIENQAERVDFIRYTLDQLLYDGMDSENKSFRTASETSFNKLLETLNKKVRDPDLLFSDFELAGVIHDLETLEKVIYLAWRQ